MSYSSAQLAEALPPDHPDFTITFDHYYPVPEPTHLDSSSLLAMKRVAPWLPLVVVLTLLDAPHTNNSSCHPNSAINPSSSSSLSISCHKEREMSVVDYASSVSRGGAGSGMRGPGRLRFSIGKNRFSPCHLLVSSRLSPRVTRLHKGAI